MIRPDTGRLLGLATKVLTQKAVERAHGGWIPEKERFKRQKETEKQKKDTEKRPKKADGGEIEKKPDDQPYDLGQQLQRGAEILGGTAQAQYERYGEPIVTGIQKLMRPVQEGGGPESYQNPEMVGHALDVVGGLGAGSLLTGPAAAETGVLRSGMGPVVKEAVAQAPRLLSPIGFYSAAAERASQLQPKGDVAQMISALKNTQGLKAEELMNAGLIDAQGNVHPEWANRGTVTREDLVSHLQSQMPQVEETVLTRNQGGYSHRTPEEWQGAITAAERSGNWDEAERLTHAWENFEGVGVGAEGKQAPKYAQYTLPGGENYREVLLKYKDPANTRKMEIEDAQQIRDVTPEEAAEHKSLLGSAIDYRSPHWRDDPNVLAHIRMADRTGPNGEKILHVEELQSDWGQKGKKEGFAIGPEEKAAAKAKMEEIEKQVAEQGHDANNQQQAEWIAARTKLDNRGIPPAPYVTSTEGWTDLALKRVLKEAAEGGYDKVVWTPGAEQAARYDLSKQISKLTYLAPDSKFGDKFGTNLRAYDHQGNVVINKTVPPKELENYVGKEVAQKLIDQEADKWGKKELSGLDLSVGGEGMAGYYDNIVPKRLQAIAKKHDKNAKVGYTDVMLPPSKNRGTNNPPIQAPGIDITPAMRESILKGQTAYQRGGYVQNLKNGGRVYPLSDREDWKEHQRDPEGKIVHMTPDEFLGKAQKLEDTKENKKDIKHWEKKIEKGKKMGPAALYTDGTQDGRHRVVAAKKAGIKKIPVLTWPNRGEENAKDYMKSAHKIARTASKK